ncbi:hypothetical protein LTR86_006211 [Recurvomyces mirabilis]|nr:hypothetical protein LTR86_006211 [Recurvomyces mirabilis]
MSEVGQALDGSGIEKVGGWIKKTHHDIHAGTDPRNVTLPQPYVVCIVGASRGIGAGIARAYTQAGASGLVLASRRVSGLEETAEECKKINAKAEFKVISCDITSPQSVEDLASQTKAAFGRLDALIINSGAAGGNYGVKLADVPAEEIVNVTNVNYTGSFLCVKYFIPLLLATKDGAKAIVGINSYAALMVRGPFLMPAYSGSKAAQLRLLELAHEQYHADGLNTYSVHPGAVPTDLALGTNFPKEFNGLLKDSTDLAGGFSVWLTKDRKQEWLSGRFASAEWDVEELSGKKSEVVEKDLLKLTMDV